MNRSIETVHFRTSAINRGEVLIATEVGHPGRGVLPCPAAPLVAASVSGRGVSARYGHATARDEGPSVMFVTSYVPRSGSAIGLAAAASEASPAAVAAARAAVETWSSVLRTRRVLRSVVPPLCPGARRALDLTRNALADGPAYVRGELAGGTDLDVIPVSDLTAVPDRARVVFPAHGVSLAIRAEAAVRGLRVIDATCPVIERAQADLREFADEGDTVLLIGRSSHSAAEGLAGQAGERTVFAETVSDVRSAEITGPASYVLQPGIPVEELVPLVTALRDRYPARGQHPDAWCYDASDRAATLEAVARGSDVMLLVGAATAADLPRLEGATHVHVIDDAEEIQPQWVASAATIGLAETAAARPGAMERVITALSGLGPLSIVERGITTTVGDQAGRAAGMLT